MKFSENWLRQHVTIDADSAALERRLTMIGLEVEGVERIGAALEGVIVARILECAKHPEADRLQVCQVDTGTQRLQIVCGAPNARPGLVAPLATIGTRVGEITIKAFDLGFEPNTIQVAAAGSYPVMFTNTGSAVHDVTFADGTKLTAQPGATVHGTVAVPAAGITFL